MVYDRFQFVKQVTGNQNGCIGIGSTEDTLNDLVTSDQINAIQRFVQHADFRIAGKCCRNFQLCRHARGQRLDFQIRCQLHELQQGSEPRFVEILEKVRIKLSHIANLHIIIIKWLRAHVRNMLFGFHTNRHILIGNAAGVRLYQTGSSFHHCAFSAAVGTDQCIDMTGLERDAQIVESLFPAVNFCNMFKFQHDVPSFSCCCACASSKCMISSLEK